MTTGTIVLIVAIVIVVAVVAVIVLQRGSRHEAAERAKAEQIRAEAAEHDRELREREAEATEARAHSELARAEAEKQQLEAERLEREASERSASAGEVRDEREEQLRLADQHDPDVLTDDDGHRVDADGNRLAREEHATSPETSGDGVVHHDRQVPDETVDAEPDRRA